MSIINEFQKELDDIHEQLALMKEAQNLSEDQAAEEVIAGVSGEESSFQATVQSLVQSMVSMTETQRDEPAGGQMAGTPAAANDSLTDEIKQAIASIGQELTPSIDFPKESLGASFEQPDITPIVDLARSNPVSDSPAFPEHTQADQAADSSFPDMSRQEPMSAGLSPFSLGIDDIQKFAGSVESEEKDILEAEDGATTELLTRIADGIGRLVEIMSNPGRDGRGGGGQESIPGPSQVGGWSLMGRFAEEENSASPSMDPDDMDHPARTSARRDARRSWRPSVNGDAE